MQRYYFQFFPKLKNTFFKKSVDKKLKLKNNLKEFLKNMTENKIIVVAGPPGVGKNTCADLLVQQFPNKKGYPQSRITTSKTRKLKKRIQVSIINKKVSVKFARFRLYHNTFH